MRSAKVVAPGLLRWATLLLQRFASPVSGLTVQVVLADWVVWPAKVVAPGLLVVWDSALVAVLGWTKWAVVDLGEAAKPVPLLAERGPKMPRCLVYPVTL